MNLQSFVNWLKIKESFDYRGEHAAPDRENGSPMHNLTPTFGEDLLFIKKNDPIHSNLRGKETIFKIQKEMRYEKIQRIY